VSDVQCISIYQLFYRSTGTQSQLSDWKDKKKKIKNIWKLGAGDSCLIILATQEAEIRRTLS
jgi:hypothetical protein